MCKAGRGAQVFGLNACTTALHGTYEGLRCKGLLSRTKQQVKAMCMVTNVVQSESVWW